MGKVLGLDFDICKQFGPSVALVYNELQFWGTKKSARKDGWIYKSYDEMTERIPLSERTIRSAYKTLGGAGLIETKVMMLDGKPTLHYQLCRNESANIAETIESANIAETIYTVTNHKTNNMVETKNGPITKQEFLSKLISLVNKKEKGTEDRLRLLNARLKEYTAEEIWFAGVALTKSDWHKANGQMSIDNLLRPSKFGRWYAASTGNAPKSTASDGSVMEAATDEEFWADMDRMKEEQRIQDERNKEMIEATKGMVLNPETGEYEEKAEK